MQQQTVDDKIKSFTIGHQKKSPFQKHKEQVEAKKKVQIFMLSIIFILQARRGRSSQANGRMGRLFQS